MMHRSPTSRSRPWARSRLVRSAFVVAALALPAAAAAQLGAGVTRSDRLEPTSNSAAAVREFNDAIADFNNVQPARGTEHLRRALDADPGLGIARVLFAIRAPGLTRAQRETDIARGMNDAARASTPELLLATAYRAQFRGDFVEAQTLFRSASQVLPNDPNIAYQLAMAAGQVPGNRFTAQIAPLRTLTTRFADYAPPYNILAYHAWRSGDRVGAFEMAQMYLAKAPSDPNPHDTNGELLQWSGRYDESIASYRRALSIDPTFTVAALGIAEVQVLQGRSDLARTTITEVIPRLATSAERVTYLRQVAGTHFLDGNAKLAMTAYGDVATEAKAGGDAAAVSNAHLSMAITDGILGDGKGIAPHLAMVGDELGAVNKAYLSGLAYASSKQVAPARAALLDLEKAAMTNQTPASAQSVNTLRALILLAEGKASEAVTEIGKTGLATATSRAVLALAEQQMGNLVAARSLRDEILTDRMLNLNSSDQLFARRLVRRIT